MLSEREKQIAWDAFRNCPGTREQCAHAAVEAVLAERTPAPQEPSLQEKVEAVLDRFPSSYSLRNETAAEIIALVEKENS